MKNPLNKRLSQFRKDLGKYLVIFPSSCNNHWFCLGFLVADGSMIKSL